MKQDLRRTDTEISTKFYNNPLIIEGVEREDFIFRKFTRSATLIEQPITQKEITNQTDYYSVKLYSETYVLKTI